MTATPYQPDDDRDAQLTAEVAEFLAGDPSVSVRGRYDDTRTLVVTPGANYEIAVGIDNTEPLLVDALDLLRVVSHVALNLVHIPPPTELEDGS